MHPIEMSNLTTKTILVAEDNEDDVFALKRAFKKAEIVNPLQVVTHGQAAVDYLEGAGEYADREKYPLPLLVFLDLKMPYLNGFEVLSWIRQRPELDSLPVVVLTSSDENRDHQKAYSLGARSYLVKPPDPDEIKRLITSLDSLWQRMEVRS
jgi:CheY-like chemotaxis protein